MADTATSEIEVETPPAEGSSQAEPKDEFVPQLSKIYKRLKFSKKLKSAMKEVSRNCSIFSACVSSPFISQWITARRSSSASREGILMTTILCRFVCHSAPRHCLVTWL